MSLFSRRAMLNGSVHRSLHLPAWRSKKTTDLRGALRLFAQLETVCIVERLNCTGSFLSSSWPNDSRLLFSFCFLFASFFLRIFLSRRISVEFSFLPIVCRFYRSLCCSVLGDELLRHEKFYKNLQKFHIRSFHMILIEIASTI